MRWEAIMCGFSTSQLKYRCPIQTPRILHHIYILNQMFFGLDWITLNNLWYKKTQEFTIYFTVTAVDFLGKKFTIFDTIIAKNGIRIPGDHCFLISSSCNTTFLKPSDISFIPSFPEFFCTLVSNTFSTTLFFNFSPVAFFGTF